MIINATKVLCIKSFSFINVIPWNLSIISNPKGARIYLNEVYKGATNRNLTNLAPGDYDIKINKTGYTDFLTSATVYFGQVTYVNIMLNEGEGVKIPNNCS